MNKKILVFNGSPKKEKSDTLKQILTPMIPPEVYEQIVNGNN